MSEPVEVIQTPVDRASQVRFGQAADIKENSHRMNIFVTVNGGFWVKRGSFFVITILGLNIEFKRGFFDDEYLFIIIIWWILRKF